MEATDCQLGCQLHGGVKGAGWACKFWCFANSECICLRGKWCLVHTSSHSTAECANFRHCPIGGKEVQRKMTPPPSHQALQIQKTTHLSTPPRFGLQAHPHALITAEQGVSVSSEFWEMAWQLVAMSSAHIPTPWRRKLPTTPFIH